MLYLKNWHLHLMLDFHKALHCKVRSIQHYIMAPRVAETIEYILDSSGSTTKIPTQAINTHLIVEDTKTLGICYCSSKTCKTCRCTWKPSQIGKAFGDWQSFVCGKCLLNQLCLIIVMDLGLFTTRTLNTHKSRIKGVNSVTLVKNKYIEILGRLQEREKRVEEIL